jgi:hypothetical protein
MSADEFSAPLGQGTTKKRQFSIPISPAHALAAALALFTVVFVVWALVAKDPLGGEPFAVAPADVKAAAVPPAKAPGAPDKAVAAAPSTPAASSAGPGGTSRSEGPAPTATPSQSSAAAPATPPGSKTVTIIDGTSGKRQDIVVPDTRTGKSPSNIDQRYLETTRHGPVPKIGPDGARPSGIYAQAAKATAGKADGPRVAIVVGGLGISAAATAEALAKLPAPVTFAFAPYGTDVDRVAARARGEGHEILLQVPMEPFDYPDSDPGPQTLLTSLTPEQNLDRLHWIMSRIQGYVGMTNHMGARFTASEQAVAPVLREAAKRGLIFVDDGTSPRSLTGQLAGANNLPFAKSDLMLDAVPTPVEIDRALNRLEMTARERGLAVGVASALPVTIDRIAQWAKAAANRGLVLVPISAIALKPKSSS